MQSPIITWWLFPAVFILCYFLCGQGSLCFVCSWTSVMSNHAAQLKVKFRPHFYWLILIDEEYQNVAFDWIFDTSNACLCASSCFGTFRKCSHGDDETLVSVGTHRNTWDFCISSTNVPFALHSSSLVLLTLNIQPQNAEGSCISFTDASTVGAHSGVEYKFGINWFSAKLWDVWSRERSKQPAVETRGALSPHMCCTITTLHNDTFVQRSFLLKELHSVFDAFDRWNIYCTASQCVKDDLGCLDT